MRITVFGATGGIGAQVVRQAIEAGHQVTAVVRDPARLAGPRPDRIVTAAVTEAPPEVLADAVAGADAVLSGLGPRSRADRGVGEAATRAVVRAMKATDARRIIVVSAAPVSTTPSPGRPRPPRRDPGEGFVMRNVLTPMIKVGFDWNYLDLALMEDVLRDSGLDWTSVRPPRLTDKPRTGRYRTAIEQNLRGGMTIARADVADLMLTAIERTETIGHAIGIAN
ncbi:MAG TPA: NAD(P)H-binding protein [Pseudonocardiaceae bacterium]|jgi:putative NADH-flavin reductase|nr:NAD(P)H-binding protein [Pseudonocardiaceae bacterium]